VPHPHPAARRGRRTRTRRRRAVRAFATRRGVPRGTVAAVRELSLFLAPTINAYKRYQPGGFAPTAVT
jgi:hypothetical protein